MIWQNTSSDLQKATMQAVGIELPNLSRENLYLSEILNNSDFKKEIKLPIALGKRLQALQ